MRPFDPRLAKFIKPVRATIGLTAVLSFAAAACLVVQAVALAQAISFAFLDHESLEALTNLLVIGLGAWLVRTALTAVGDWWARRAGLQTVAQARSLALSRITMAPQTTVALEQGAMSTLLTRGVEGLETYVARYLPQLVISAIVPLGLGLTILWLDPLAAVIIAITIPLIPIFMALVGWFTQSNVEKHWQKVLSLSSTIADLMNGLPELSIFGRARAQAAEIDRLGRAQQTATMKVLRLSFLSAFVLELLATISVAIIAVAVGLRLVNGEMELWKGLAALVLAPEVYAPLRMLGVHFHAAADGLEAWAHIDRVLLATERERGTAHFPRSMSARGGVGLNWSDLKVQLGDRTIHIPAGRARAGEVTAVVGPSGCGKSTLLSVALGNVIPVAGTCLYLGEESKAMPDEIAAPELAANVGYVAQNPWLGEGTVFEVVTRGISREVAAADVVRLMEALGVSLSLDAHISDRSQGVSVGQRRRLAVARAILRKPRVLILDEPSAALDDASEVALLDVLRGMARDGTAVLIVAHRDSVREIADNVVDFTVVSA